MGSDASATPNSGLVDLPGFLADTGIKKDECAVISDGIMTIVNFVKYGQSVPMNLIWW
jgi:hypothetical protein